MVVIILTLVLYTWCKRAIFLGRLSYGMVLRNTYFLLITSVCTGEAIDRGLRLGRGCARVVGEFYWSETRG